MMAEQRESLDTWAAFLADAEECYANNANMRAIIATKSFRTIGSTLYLAWQGGDEQAYNLYRRLQRLCLQNE